MRKTSCVAFAVSALAFSGLARADLVYDFSLDLAIDADISGASFSFTVPSFVVSSQSPAFTQFTLTDFADPPNSWTMINDLVDGNSFMFDNGGNSSCDPTCYGDLYLYDLGPAPTTTGSYSLYGNGYFDLVGQSDTVESYVVASLNITGTAESPVPEPHTNILLLSIPVIILGWKLRKRLA